jgi:ABC-type multidrug transport system fused ATPase/permease subunit
MFITEFAIPKSWESDRRGPAHWVTSHAARHKIFITGVFIGAFSNAGLAAAVPLFIGRAFDMVAAAPSDLRSLGRVAGLLVVSQVVRGVLMLGRNFPSAEPYDTYFRHQSPDYKPEPFSEPGG